MHVDPVVDPHQGLFKNKAIHMHLTPVEVVLNVLNCKLTVTLSATCPPSCNLALAGKNSAMANSMRMHKLLKMNIVKVGRYEYLLNALFAINSN